MLINMEICEHRRTTGDTSLVPSVCSSSNGGGQAPERWQRWRPSNRTAWFAASCRRASSPLSRAADRAVDSGPHRSPRPSNALRAHSRRPWRRRRSQSPKLPPPPPHRNLRGRLKACASARLAPLPQPPTSWRWTLKNRRVCARKSALFPPERIGGFRREVQPCRQHWFLNEKSGFPFRTPAFCSVSRGRRRLGEKEYRAPSVTPGVALRPRTQGSTASTISRTGRDCGMCPKR